VYQTRLSLACLRKREYILVSIILFIFLSFQLTFLKKAEAINPNVGTTSAEFLKIGVGARAIGMGKAFTGVANDVTTIYWNPAGLALLKNHEVSLMHAEWFENLRYEALSYVFPIEFGSLGLQVFGIWATDFETRDDLGNPSTGSFSACEYAIGLAYGREVISEIYAGFTLNVIFSKLAEKTANSIALNVGILYQLPLKFLRVGLAIKNLGNTMYNNFPIPFETRIGISSEFLDGCITIATDGVIRRGEVLHINIGMEVRALSSKEAPFTSSIRGGYITGLSENDLGSLFGLSVGMGFGFFEERIMLDYAYTPSGDLGNTHQISLGIKL